MDATTVLTIGNFDGAHLGHVALIRRARDLAGPNGRVVALAFDPHPFTTLAPATAPLPLSSLEQRSRWLIAAGADQVDRLEPTPHLLALTPDQFIDRKIRQYRPDCFVEGPDFHFGAGRIGNTQTLADLAHERGLAVEIVEPVEIDLTDQTIVTCSSTITRWLIANGRVRDAARVLGRLYEVTGEVQRGDQRGRTIGFPTANLVTIHAPPADGVYAALATLPTGEVRPAATHVGPRSTFDCQRRTIEAYLPGWDAPLDDYGYPLTIRFLAFLRDQARFDSADELVNQMRLDTQRTLDIATNHAHTDPQPEPADA